jgi:hypothetical protein
MLIHILCSVIQRSLLAVPFPVMTFHLKVHKLGQVELGAI